MQKALNAGERLNPKKLINGKNIFFPEIQVGFNLAQSFLKAFHTEHSILWCGGNLTILSGEVYVKRKKTTMTRLIAGFIIAGFLGLMLFGFPMMQNGMHPDSSCFASVFAGLSCSAGAFGMSAHHIAAYQNFFHSLSLSSISLLAFVFFALVFALIRVFLNQLALRRQSLLYSLRLWLKREWQSDPHSFLRSWLTLLEKRAPTHVFSWCGFEFASVLMPKI